MSQFIHERPDFKDLILALGLDLKIEPQLVEKDYWIMCALWGLQDLKFDFELKGGTSLSKGWNCISRFSEDIDIKILPPLGVDLRVGPNHDKPNQIKQRQNYFDELALKIKISGFVKTERDVGFDDEKMRNAGIRLLYDSPFDKLEGVKDGVLLEVGFDKTTPNEEVDISSWLIDRAKKVSLPVFDNSAKKVKCYLPEYTFVEKLQTISTKYRQQQQSKQMPVNFMRHYYDTFNLIKIPRVQKFIGTDPYKAHKANRFRSKDEMDLTINDAFILSDKETRELYKGAYEKTKNLYFSGQPSLDSILSELKKWLPKL